MNYEIPSLKHSPTKSMRFNPIKLKFSSNKKSRSKIKINLDKIFRNETQNIVKK
jgi:hypothetical protein